MLDFKYSNYSLSIKIELDSSQNFKDSKLNLKNKLNSLIDSNSYSLEISNDGISDVLNIYFCFTGSTSKVRQRLPTDGCEVS